MISSTYLVVLCVCLLCWGGKRQFTICWFHVFFLKSNKLVAGRGQHWAHLPTARHYFWPACEQTKPYCMYQAILRAAKVSYSEHNKKCQMSHCNGSRALLKAWSLNATQGCIFSSFTSWHKWTFRHRGIVADGCCTCLIETSGQACVGPPLWALNADKMCQVQGNTLWDRIQPGGLASLMVLGQMPSLFINHRNKNNTKSRSDTNAELKLRLHS